MISVILPVYNRPELLGRAIRSVLSQQNVEFELFVVDDGSSLSQAENRDLVLAAGHQFIRQKPSGVSAARNNGVRLSSGKYLAFLDSDDEWLPQKLALQAAFHLKYPEYRISQCLERWIRNGKRVNPKAKHAQAEGDAFARSLEICCISPSAVFLERELFFEVGGFDERLPVCEDYDLWIRITAQEFVGLLKSQLVIRYGGHDDQLSKSLPAFDRFRVVALSKLLESTAPDDDKKELIRNSLRAKLDVLFKGARKRNNSPFVAALDTLRAALENGERLSSIYPKLLVEEDVCKDYSR